MSDLVQQQQQDHPATELPVIGTNSAALILDEKSMQRMEALADMMAAGRSTVPTHLQKSKGDCMAVIMQAVQWGMNPFAVAQKTHVVNGQLGYEAQLVNAVISTSGALKGRPEYEWFGPWESILGKFKVVTKKGEAGKRDTEFRVPGWSLNDEKGCGVRIWATLKGEDAPRELTLMLEQASVRNSPLWASDPKQQLAYLGIKRWSRLYAPDVLLGVYTPDELEEAPMKDINAPLPKNAKPQDVAERKRNAEPVGPDPKLLKASREAADKGYDTFNEYWKTLKAAQKESLRAEFADLQHRTQEAEKNRTIDAEMPTAPEQAAPSDDDFVRGMDRASGQTGDGDYVPQ